jgi:hypothetical protein
MIDFKIGDEVECVKSFPDFPKEGWKGRVVHYSENVIPTDICVGVEWEHSFSMGHTCDGSGKHKYCRFYYDTGRETSSADLSVIKKKSQLQLELF